MLFCTHDFLCTHQHSRKTNVFYLSATRTDEFGVDYVDALFFLVLKMKLYGLGRGTGDCLSKKKRIV